MLETVCLVVVGIVGQFCYSPALPVGECTEMGYGQVMCVVEEYELPLFLSVYDPALCAAAPINCDGDADFGTGIPFGEEWYEVGVACPVDWVWSVVTVPGIGEWRCIDTGGRIEPHFREVWLFEPGDVRKVWMWVVVVDVVYPQGVEGWPWWALQVYSDWSRS